MFWLDAELQARLPKNGARYEPGNLSRGSAESSTRRLRFRLRAGVSGEKFHKTANLHCLRKMNRNTPRLVPVARRVQSTSRPGARVPALPHVNRFPLRRSEEHTSELQSPCNLVCRLLLEKKKKK